MSLTVTAVEAPKRPSLGDPHDRSVDGFRFRNGPMSRSSYYKLKQKGLAPREIHLGRKILITRQDELAWQEARANPKGAEARLIAREAEQRSIRTRHAGKLAAQSPRHISKRRRSA